MKQNTKPRDLGSRDNNNKNTVAAQGDDNLPNQPKHHQAIQARMMMMMNQSVSQSVETFPSGGRLTSRVPPWSHFPS